MPEAKEGENNVETGLQQLGGLAESFYDGAVILRYNDGFKNTEVHNVCSICLMRDEPRNLSWFIRILHPRFC